MDHELSQVRELYIHQKKELAELFGFETRNKYVICDQNNHELFFAAEQQKGLAGFFMRQFLGHWRSYEISIFDRQKNLVLRATHPFRFFFQRLEVYTSQGVLLGALQGRFAFFCRKFDFEDAHGRLLAQVSSPWYKFWTFPIMKKNKEVAMVKKKWSGFFSEVFTDGDKFHISFLETTLELDLKKLIMAAGLFIDLQYFERKASK